MENIKTIDDIIRLLLTPCGFFRLSVRSSRVWCFEGFSAQKVEEALLLKLLKRSRWVSPIRIWIVDILSLTLEGSITDKVFFECLHYPGKFRKTLVIQLAHLWLSKEQLLSLNSLLDTPEAFCKLLILFSVDEAVSLEQYQRFLLNNTRFVNQVDCFDVLERGKEKGEVSFEKRSILEQFVCENAKV